MKKEKYNVVIIDDEDLCINSLCNSLEENERFEVVATEKRAEIGKKLIMTVHPDLLFVDIEMPTMSGLDLVRSIKEEVNWEMQVVFYTAFDKYLLEALRESAFDYLLKPYQEEELNTVLKRFINHSESNNAQKESFDEQVSNLYSTRNARFLVTTVRGYQMINTEDVGYFEYNTLKRLWHIVLRDKTVNIKRGTTSADLIHLSDNLIQVNQHQIINTNYLDTIENKKCKLLSPFDEKEFMISRKYQQDVEDHFFML